MTQAVLVLTFLFLALFVVLIVYFTRRISTGPGVILRHINAFERLKGFTARAVETGRMFHLSLGLGGVANETTADTLAGLSILGYLARQAAATGATPTISMADPTVMLFAQNALQAAYTDDLNGLEEAYHHTQWIASRPAAYAAGVMNILQRDTTEANVMVGNFGDEYLLMGETAARRGLAHVGGASNPNTLPFIYVSADETLLGEEIYAAGAYLQKSPVHIGSLAAQDAMRWLITLIIFGGILVATLG